MRIFSSGTVNLYTIPFVSLPNKVVSGLNFSLTHRMCEVSQGILPHSHSPCLNFLRIPCSTVFRLIDDDNDDDDDDELPVKLRNFEIVTSSNTKKKHSRENIFVTLFLNF